LENFYEIGKSKCNLRMSGSALVRVILLNEVVAVARHTECF
jgi:hypothetical protein